MKKHGHRQKSPEIELVDLYTSLHIREFCKHFKNADFENHKANSTKVLNFKKVTNKEDYDEILFIVAECDKHGERLARWYLEFKLKF